MKLAKILILFLISNFAFCQTVIVEFVNKDNEKVNLIAYSNLQSASKINPDSIQALDLVSQGYVDFPNEILKFKNLRYLNIDSYNWSQVLDSLTEKEKLLYDELKAKACDKCGVMKFFKPSTIRKIPKKIKNLKKLEYVSFGEGIYLVNKRKFKRIYRYLPKALIFPNKFDLETD